MKKQNKAGKAGKNVAKDNASEMVKTNHSMRLNAEQKGIGLMASGSYVARRFNRAAYDRTIEAVNGGKLRFNGDTKVVIAKGETEKGGSRGILARFARIDTTGKFAQYRNGSVLGLDVIDTSVVSIEAMVAACIKRNEIVVVRRKNAAKGEAKEITGFLMGSLGDTYSVCVYALSGKVVFKDIETRANVYNAKELVSLGDKSKVVAQAAAIGKALKAAIAATAKAVKSVAVRKVSKAEKLAVETATETASA